MARLDELREEWRVVYDDMQGVTSQTRRELEHLKEDLRVAEAPFRERLKRLEEAMRPLVTPDTPKVGHGVKITHRRAYDKVTWNGKALQGYAVADPNVLHFRSKTTVKASTSFSRVDE